jgi:hypothetical protein
MIIAINNKIEPVYVDYWIHPYPKQKIQKYIS